MYRKNRNPLDLMFSAYEYVRTLPLDALPPAVDISLLSNVLPSSKASLLFADAPLNMAADDHGNTIATSTAIVIGSTISAVLDYANDIDVFSFTAMAGQLLEFIVDYTIDLGFPPSAYIVDSNNNNVVGGTEAAMRFEVTASGTYYLFVTMSEFDSESYTITSSEIVDDYAADISTTGALSIGGTTTGSFQFNDDWDWFSIDIGAGDLVGLLLSTESGDAENLAFRIYGSTGLELNAYLGGVQTGALNLEYETGGTYYIAVGASNVGSDGSYTLSATTIIDDFSGDVTTTGHLAFGDTVSGYIDYRGDVDWFSIDVESDSVIKFDIGTISGSPISGSLLTVYDASGAIISQIDSAENVEQLVLKIDVDGTYYIEVASQINAAQTNIEGGYEVTVSEITNEFSSDINTQGVLSVGGARVASGLDYRNDVDWIAVDAQAGQYLEFMVTLPDGTTLTNPEMHLFDADGNEITDVIDELGGARLGYIFDTTDTYYISVSSSTYYTNPGAQGAYEINVTTPEVPSPLNAINWGTALPGAGEGMLVIPYFLQGVASAFLTIEDIDVDTVDWLAYEIQQLRMALDVIESVINVQFVEVDTREAATFTLAVENNTGDTSLLGYFGPPESDEVPGLAGVGVFNRAGHGWEEGGSGGLDIGGYGFSTLLHELGHGLGLAHPHDIGGGSEILLGVDGSPYFDRGQSDLNQSVYTIMSYVRDWSGGPYHSLNATGYGWMASLGALDIAVLQENYGTNTSQNSGDDVYHLEGVATEAYYQSIWDTGGIDTIEAYSSFDVIINLNSASLTYANNGGGEVSYITNLSGGMTIAMGAVIENARSGDGEDTLIGNEVANVLSSGDQNDQLFGGAGDDSLYGGAGDDQLTGGTGADTYVIFEHAGEDQILDFEDGVDHIQFGEGLYSFASLKIIQDGADTLIYSANGVTRLVGIDAALIDMSDFNFTMYSQDGRSDGKASPAPDAVLLTTQDEVGLQYDALEGVSERQIALTDVPALFADQSMLDDGHWDMYLG